MGSSMRGEWNLVARVFVLVSSTLAAAAATTATAVTLANGNFHVDIDDRNGTILNVSFGAADFYPEAGRISDYALQVREERVAGAVVRNSASIVRSDGLHLDDQIVIDGVVTEAGVVTVTGSYRPRSGARVKFRRRYSIEPRDAILRVDFELLNQTDRSIDLLWADVFDPNQGRVLERTDRTVNEVFDIARGLRGASASNRTLYDVMMTSRDPRAVLFSGLRDRPVSGAGLEFFFSEAAADPEIDFDDRNILVGGRAVLAPGEFTTFTYYQAYAAHQLLAKHYLANAIFGPCYAVDAVDDVFVVVDRAIPLDFIQLPVLANEECANDHPLTVLSAPGPTSPDRGGFAWTEDGLNISYVPPVGFLGTETFQYTVRDARQATSDGVQIAADEDTATVTVSVVADRDPVARADRASIAGGKPTSIEVLRNDDRGNTPVGIEIVRPPYRGGAFVRGTAIRYEPDSGAVDSDSFSYSITDLDGDRSVAEVRLDWSFDPGALPMYFSSRGFEERTVVILSVAPRFDAPSSVDRESIAIGPGAARSVGWVDTWDVNYDGYADLTLPFRIEDTGLACDATRAGLTGKLIDGTRISGSARISPAGC